MQVRLRRDARRPSGPWIHEKLVARELGPPDPTALAEVVDHRGGVVGRGLYSPQSRLRVRLLTRGDQPVPETWLRARIHDALARRTVLGLHPEGPTTGWREINSEGDGLPGLTVDRHGTTRVVVLGTAPMAARKEEILAALEPGPERTLVVVPETAARLEGLRASFEGQPPDVLSWRENGLELEAAAPPAQKTGAYHDQRANRQRLAQLALRSGGPLLDLGCHVGGFSLAAGAAGVVAHGIDSSEQALEFARRNAAHNDLSACTFSRGDFFDRAFEVPAGEGGWGAAVFDPPKIASSARDAGRAGGAVGAVVAKVLPKLRPAGVLAVCSCSQHFGTAALRKAVDEASATCGVGVRAIDRWGADVDHPIALDHDEGEYLQVLVVQRNAH